MMRSDGYVVSDWQALVSAYAVDRNAAIVTAQPRLDNLPYIDFTGAEVFGHKILKRADSHGRRWKLQCKCGAHIERPYLKVFKAALDFRYSKPRDLCRKISCAECLKSEMENAA